MEILIVEDEAELSDLTVDYLSRVLGAKTSSCQSGNEAIRLIERGLRHDVIVTDYHMEDGNGVELLTYMSQRRVASTAVMFTAIANVHLPNLHIHFLGVVPKMNLKLLAEVIASGSMLVVNPK